MSCELPERSNGCSAPNGSLNFPDNAPMTINGDSAMIDFDTGTFKPPIYLPYQITKVTDIDVNFGLETSTTFSQRVSNQRSCQLLNGHEVREESCSYVHQCTDDNSDSDHDVWWSWRSSKPGPFSPSKTRNRPASSNRRANNPALTKYLDISVGIAWN